jgi:hypothetical protein
VNDGRELIHFDRIIFSTFYRGLRLSRFKKSWALSLSAQLLNWKKKSWSYSSEAFGLTASSEVKLAAPPSPPGKFMAAESASCIAVCTSRIWSHKHWCDARTSLLPLAFP